MRRKTPLCWCATPTAVSVIPPGGGALLRYEIATVAIEVPMTTTEPYLVCRVSRLPARTLGIHIAVVARDKARPAGQPVEPSRPSRRGCAAWRHAVSRMAVHRSTSATSDGCVHGDGARWRQTKVRQAVMAADVVSLCPPA